MAHLSCTAFQKSLTYFRASLGSLWITAGSLSASAKPHSPNSTDNDVRSHLLPPAMDGHSQNFTRFVKGTLEWVLYHTIFFTYWNTIPLNTGKMDNPGCLQYPMCIYNCQERLLSKIVGFFFPKQYHAATQVEFCPIFVCWYALAFLYSWLHARPKHLCVQRGLLEIEIYSKMPWKGSLTSFLQWG